MATPLMPTASNPYPDLTGGTGVVPMTVEPLHGMEKDALMQLGGGLNGGGNISLASQMLQQMATDPQGFAAKYTNPQATNFMTQAGTATSAGMNPITQSEIQGVANPFAGALKNRLTEDGQRARAAILAGQGVRGARSFGDTSQGVRQGMLDTEMLSKSGDIDYKTFQDASTMLENMRNRSLQAGGQFGNLAVGAQGITNSAVASGANSLTNLADTGFRLNDANTANFKNKLAAGQTIRGYNQGVNDLIGNDMLAQAGDPAAKMSQILGWLNSFKSDTSGAVPAANGTQKLGGLLGAGGDLLGAFGGGGGSALPWQAAGNINPLGGFY